MKYLKFKILFIFIIFILLVILYFWIKKERGFDYKLYEVSLFMYTNVSSETGQRSSINYKVKVINNTKRDELLRFNKALLIDEKGGFNDLVFYVDEHEVLKSDTLYFDLYLFINPYQNSLSTIKKEYIDNIKEYHFFIITQHYDTLPVKHCSDLTIKYYNNNIKIHEKDSAFYVTRKVPLPPN